MADPKTPEDLKQLWDKDFDEIKRFVDERLARKTLSGDPVARPDEIAQEVKSRFGRDCMPQWIFIVIPAHH